MGEGSKTGLAAAVEAVGVEDAPEEFREAHQLPLMPADDVSGLVATIHGGQRGRPRGSRNKSTTEWVKFIQARYRSPLEFLAETYSRPVSVLASEIGCDLKEAFQLQLQAAVQLAPYMHQKQPQALQVASQGDVNMVFSVSPEWAALLAESAAEAGETLDLVAQPVDEWPDEESEENQ